MEKKSTYIIDMLGKRCRECEIGNYQETSIYDNWEGVVHCARCGHQEIRHKEVQIPLTKTVD